MAPAPARPSSLFDEAGAASAPAAPHVSSYICPWSSAVHAFASWLAR